ncbi:acyl-CoA N-acyltransferase [Meredithblackwellia eburnea MCA 4105]
MSSNKQPLEVVLTEILPGDLLEVAKGNREAFPTFYDPIENCSVSVEERDLATAHRLQSIIASPHVFAVKAAIGSKDGPLGGIALWSRPGSPIYHFKRRGHFVMGPETDEDRKAWASVDPVKWEKAWQEWDDMRAKIMGDVPHWYIAPLWVKPEYQKRGIGRKLLQQVMDLADEHGHAIYLEASQEGKKVYDTLGFTVEGPSFYVEMVRWGTSRDKKKLE